MIHAQTFQNRKLAVKPNLATFAIAPVSIPENNPDMDLGWLHAEITRRGITQRELADAIGLTESKMSKTFNGGRKLTANEMFKALRFLGYPVPGEAETLLQTIVRLASERDEAQQRAVISILETLPPAR